MRSSNTAEIANGVEKESGHRFRSSNAIDRGRHQSVVATNAPGFKRERI